MKFIWIIGVLVSFNLTLYVKDASIRLSDKVVDGGWIHHCTYYRAVTIYTLNIPVQQKCDTIRIGDTRR